MNEAAGFLSGLSYPVMRSGIALPDGILSVLTVFAFTRFAVFYEECEGYDGVAELH
jgi:hypothetical protein